MDRRRDAGNIWTNFSNLRALAATPARTKSGRIMWAWSEIQASLNRGTKMQEIWQALCRDGIEMSYGQFRTYVWRIRKRLAASSVGVAGSPARMPEIAGQEVASEAFAGPGPTPQNRAADPLANIRREVERKRTSGFQYDPFPEVVATGAELATTPETAPLMRVKQPESGTPGRTCAGAKQTGQAFTTGLPSPEMKRI